MSYEIYREWKKLPINRRPYMSVVIPVANQADEIVPTIGAIISQLCDVCSYWELIVVDGGSTDGTDQLVADLGLSNLVLLQAGRDSTEASRLHQGVQAARGHYILTTEPENRTPIEAVTQLLPELELGTYDMAVGHRGASVAQKINAGRLSLIARLNVIDNYAETTSLMLFRQEAAKPLFRKLEDKNRDSGKEICRLADKLQYKVCRVPVKSV